MQKQFSSTNVSPGSSLGEAAAFACDDIDVLSIDISNSGSSPVAGAAIQGRLTSEAPWRDITPNTYTEADGFTVIRPSTREVVGLPPGSAVQVFLNVSLFSAVRIMLSGQGAQVKILAGGMK